MASMKCFGNPKMVTVVIIVLHVLIGVMQAVDHPGSLHPVLPSDLPHDPSSSLHDQPCKTLRCCLKTRLKACKDRKREAQKRNEGKIKRQIVYDSCIELSFANCFDEAAADHDPAYASTKYCLKICLEDEVLFAPCLRKCFKHFIKKGKGKGKKH